MSILKFEELTAPQIEVLIKENRVLLLSFGSIEQHSMHLPVGTDYLCMYKRVEKIAERVNGIMFSPLQLGYSFNHIEMQGTVSVDGELFIALVVSILKQLFAQGWKRVLLFSGHNGNWPALRVAVQTAREKYSSTQVVFAEGYPSMSVEHKKARFIKNFDYHAGLTETAIVNFFYEKLVDRERIPSSNQGTPAIVRHIIEKEEIDDIDMLLMSAVTPQHTEMLSENGMWGGNDPHAYEQIPVKRAMETYISFYVDLIKRWNKMTDENNEK